MKRKFLALFLALAMLPLPFGSIGVMAQGNGQISVVSATASSAFSADYGADKMIDGDASDTSRWCSGGSNPVLEFTFNGAQKVNKIIINEFLNPNPGNSVESFTVNAWDGADWYLVAVGSTIGAEKAIDFDTVETEKIQIVLNCAGLSSFNEVSFYGTSVAGIEADAADGTLYCGGRAHDAALDKTKIIVSQIDTAGGKTPVENGVFTFSGYDESVVSVDDDGTVHAVGAGETEITVTAEFSGQPFYAEVSIAVSNQTVERVAVGAAKNNVKVQERLPLLVYAFLDDGTKLDVTQRLAPVFETSEPDARIYNGALTLDTFTQQKNINVTAASSNGSIESTDFLAVQTQNVALSAAGALAEGTNTLAGTQDAWVNDGIRPAQSGAWNDAGVAPGDVGYMTITFPEEKTIDFVNVFTYGDDPAAEPAFESTATTFGNEDFHLEYWNGTEFAPIDGASVTGNIFAWTSFSFAPVTTEKIRVAITKTRNANSRISEIEVFEAYVPPVPAEEVQVPVARAWASSTFTALPGYEADKMIDGQLGENSRWCADEVDTPQTLEFTFDGAQKINKIVINEHEQAGNYTTNFTVNVWNGTDWVNAASGFSIGASKEIALVTQNTEKVQIKLEGVGYRSICEASFYFNPAYDEVSSITAQTAETTLYLGEEAAALGLNKTGITAFQTAASGAVLGLAPEDLSFGGFDDTVISVDAGGVVTALGAGSTSIAVSAQINGKTYVSNVAVTVSAVTVDDIAVSAPKSTVREGERLPLGVSACFSDGSTKDVTQILSPVFSVTGGSASIVNGCLVLSSYLAGDEITVAAASAAGTAISPLTLKPTRSENAALAANGATASASSELTPVASVIDGDRAGRGGAVWNDNGSASDEAPSWCQVTFAEEKTIDTIFVFTLQDDNNNPVEPTIDMTATAWGVENYFVQYEDGGQWKNVPGAQVTGNTLAWQSFSFAPITTGAIRVMVTKARMTNARITEVEAYEAEDEPQGKTQVPVKSAACDPASFPAMDPELMMTAIPPRAGAQQRPSANFGIYLCRSNQRKPNAGAGISRRH